MAGVNQVFSLADDVARYLKACGRSSVLQTKPVNPKQLKGLHFTPEIIGDTISVQNPLKILNQIFKDKYGITSQINNSQIAETLLPALDDIAKINKKNLFNGYTIRTEKFSSNEIAKRVFNAETNEFTTIFNEKFDWNNIDKITSKMYHNCEISSDNPKYLLYREFAEFLSFKNNPHAYKILEGRHYCNGSALSALRVSSSLNLNRYNANYIAGRMSGKTFPQRNKIYFEENGGINLRFPKPEQVVNRPRFYKPIKISTHSFKNIQDARSYLSTNYGINADFVNQEQANLFASAVDDLSNLFGRKDLFNGLKVSVDGSEFSTLNTKMSLSWNKDTGFAELFINPAFNWKNHAKIAKENYNSCFMATDSAKMDYIHELVHWLDFKGNPQRYGETELAWENGKKFFNDYGKSIAAKVSSYATTSPAEFCAEYVSGRMYGISYPKAVTDELFLKHWNGPNP